MPKAETIVFQSHRNPLPHPWLHKCLESVQEWCRQNRYHYLFLGDELFDPVSDKLLLKTRNQPVIATDLARLLHCQAFLSQDYQTVIWCDADFLIFEPERFILPETSYALGREVWIQQTEKKWRAYTKVHNAFLMFRRGNHFLDFYCETAQRLLSLNSGSMPPQFIGPKLLSAINNIAHCPVLENAGMLSPAVILDLLNGGGAALDLFIQNTQMLPAAANLCSSSISNSSLTDSLMHQLIALLQEQGSNSFSK